MSTPTSPQETIWDPLPAPHHQSSPPPSSPSTTTGEVTTKRKAKKVPSWVTQTLQTASEDMRRQPWKDTFGETVDCRFDDGEDLVRVERSVGGKFDPDCPFRTQGSSLAA